MQAGLLVSCLAMNINSKAAPDLAASVHKEPARLQLAIKKAQRIEFSLRKAVGHMVAIRCHNGALQYRYPLNEQKGCLDLDAPTTRDVFRFFGPQYGKMAKKLVILPEVQSV